MQQAAEVSNIWRLLFALLTCASGCRDDVPLGAWDSVGQGGAGRPGEVGAGAGGVTNTELPACGQPADPGPVNAAGGRFGATETATDWMWPSPVPSMQWDIRIEREIERVTPTSPPTSGYYWTHQFSFLEGVTGLLGIQAEGGYQLDPPNSPIEITKIAVFWLSGPPLAAELGDIPEPDARIAETSAAGVTFVTIHARFDWQVCRVYRFRVAPHSTEADGSTWYGAWIEDTTDAVSTFLGRMLLPADAGLLAPFSISRTLPIEFGEPSSCATPAQASALFGRPSTSDGRIAPSLHTNRFVDPLSCPSSRFTEFPAAVRHELGARP